MQQSVQEATGFDQMLAMRVSAATAMYVGERAAFWPAPVVVVR